MNWTKIDDITCDIENLRFNPKKASEVANDFKASCRDMIDSLLKLCEDNEEMKKAIAEYFEVEAYPEKEDQDEK